MSRSFAQRLFRWSVGERRGRLPWGVLAGGVLLLVLEVMVPDARAVPALTRKFDIDCSHCHTVAPDLNDFGERVRDRGYSTAGLEESLPEALREQVRTEDPEDLHPAYWPISLRSIVGYRLRSQDHQDSDAGEAQVKTRTFGIDRLELLWGGLLARDVNFYLTYRPALSNAAFGENGGQDGELKFAWVRFNQLADSPLLNLKLGAFELDVPVSDARRLTLSDYPIYSYFPAASDAAIDPDTTLDWGEPQLGIEVAGRRPSGFRYSVAAVNGTNGRADTNSAWDYFLRASLPVADHRIGGFGYWGTAPTRFQTTAGGTVDIQGTGSSNQTFYRVGIDGDLRVAPLRVLAVAVYGIDSAGLFPAPNQEASFTGGFVEGRYDVIQDWRTLLVARYDIIRNGTQGLISRAGRTIPKKFGDVDGVTVGARYEFLLNKRMNFIVHGEYSHLRTKLTSVDGNDQSENRVTVAFDLMI